MAWKLTKIKGNPRVLLHVLAAGTMTAMLYIMLYNLNMIALIVRWYHLLGFTLLGFGIYISILFLLGEFTKEDFLFYVDTLNIRKMVQYVKEELKKR